jgi:hypothetical protein
MAGCRKGSLMADTGAPWFIPYAEPSDLVRDWPALSEDVAEKVADALTGATYNAREVITATDATWPVPTLANSIVKVTVIGGGGGGASPFGNGTAGGTSSFVATAINVSAAGGERGRRAGQDNPGTTGTAGFASGNGGQGAQASNDVSGLPGSGGEIRVAYVNLSAISTVNVTIGAGGAGGTGFNTDQRGGDGGRGEVIVEYVAG